MKEINAKQILLVAEVKKGKRNDEYLWICDFRFNDYSKKAIRHVTPQKVLVRSNSEAPDKRIYYSESHFVGLNKAGEPLKSIIIPIVDNTGYRSLYGTSVQVFETWDECIECYKEQCRVVVTGLKEHRDRTFKDINDKIAGVEKILKSFPA